MIQKIEWFGYEGEGGSNYVTHPDKSIEEFEEDLKEIKTILNTQEQDKDFVAIPECYYELVYAALTAKGYHVHSTYINESYEVDMSYKEDLTRSVCIKKHTTKRKTEEL